jgi:aspartate aminotransferase
MEPPAEFHDELRRIAQNPSPGMHRYMPNAGYPETRQAVAATLSQETGLSFGAGEIVMTCGAAGAANVVLRTILNPGDEVIILSPFFGEYVYYIQNHNGVPVIVPTDAEFGLDLEAIEAALTARTRAIILNSPNNPSGVVYPEEGIRGLAELLMRAEARFGSEIFIISDEPYRRIIYDGLVYPQVFPHYERTVVVNSHAKDLGLPGERIGHIAVHPDYSGKAEMVDGLVFCNRVLGFVNAPALMQHVVRAVQNASVDVGEYQRKRDFIYDRLTGMGYQAVKPQGAFYLFPRSPLEDDEAFVAALQEYNVLVVPGKGFGTPGHFRISYCLEDRVLEGSMDGFARAAEQYLR